MLKLNLTIFCTLLLAVAATALKLHHEEYNGHLEEQPAEAREITEHHGEVEHKHATSHQSVKLHHFHAVPVYIKKEDQHLVKKPIDIGWAKLKLKQVHPKSEHHNGHGLVIEQEISSHRHGHDHHDHHDYEEPKHQEYYQHHHHE